MRLKVELGEVRHETGVVKDRTVKNDLETLGRHAASVQVDLVSVDQLGRALDQLECFA